MLLTPALLYHKDIDSFRELKPPIYCVFMVEETWRQQHLGLYLDQSSIKVCFLQKSDEKSAKYRNAGNSQFSRTKLREGFSKIFLKFSKLF